MYQDGNCLAAPEYHQAAQIKTSQDNVTAGWDEHGKEKYGDRRCRSDSVCWHSFLSGQGLVKGLVTNGKTLSRCIVVKPSASK